MLNALHTFHHRKGSLSFRETSSSLATFATHTHTQACTHTHKYTYKVLKNRYTLVA